MGKWDEEPVDEDELAWELENAAVPQATSTAQPVETISDAEQDHETPKRDWRKELELKRAAIQESEENPHEMISLRQAFEYALPLMERRMLGLDAPIPMPKTWSGLAELYGGGWWMNEVYGLAGNTGEGKTQFAMQAALHAAKTGHPVVYVMLELSVLQLCGRLLGSEADVSWSDLYLGKNKVLQSEAVRSAIDRLALDNFFLLAPKTLDGWNYSKLEDQVQWARQKTGLEDKPAFIVVDFLQIVMGGNARDSLRERIKHATYACTHVAKNKNSAVLLLSSTSREKYPLLNERLRKDRDDLPEVGVDDPGFWLGVGKEAGDIEYGLTGQAALCTDSDSNKWVAVSKVRIGKPEWLKATFDGRMGTFTFERVSNVDAAKASNSAERTPKAEAKERKASEFAAKAPMVDTELWALCERMDATRPYGIMELRTLWSIGLNEIKPVSEKLIEYGWCIRGVEGALFRVSLKDGDKNQEEDV